MKDAEFETDGAFYREKGKLIWQIDSKLLGDFLFSFDKKEIYNFFSDWNKLTVVQKIIFKKEFPTMAALKEK